MQIRDRIKETFEIQPAPSFPGYGATPDGRVFRIAGGRGATVGREKKATQGPDGYFRLALYSGGTSMPATLHEVVADACIGPRPTGREINHRDGDKSNNAAEKLEYVTRSQNLLHRSAMGICRGENNHRARATADIVLSIRFDHLCGLGYKRLASKYGLSWGAVRSIAIWRTWKHVA